MKTVGTFLFVVIVVTTLLSMLAPSVPMTVPGPAGGSGGSIIAGGSVSDSNDVTASSVFYWGVAPGEDVDWFERFYAIIEFFMTPFDIAKTIYEFFAGFINVILDVFEPVLEVILDMKDFFNEVRDTLFGNIMGGE